MILIKTADDFAKEYKGIKPTPQIGDIVLTIDKGIFGQIWLIEITEMLTKGWFRGYVVEVMYPEDEFWRLQIVAMHEDDVSDVVNL